MAELQRKLRASKTGDINDGFFTPENIEAAICMLQEEYPEGKYMIYASEALLPLSCRKNDEIQQQEKKYVSCVFAGRIFDAMDRETKK